MRPVVITAHSNPSPHGRAPRVLKADGVLPLTERELGLLSSVSAQLIDQPCRTERDLLRYGSDADAVLTISEPLTARVIRKLGRCRVISRFGIGLDNVDVEAATQAGIYVCHVPDYCVEEVSDHALAMLLALARKLVRLDHAVRSGRWATFETAGDVHRLGGQVLGLVGFGRIARRFAQKAAPLGLQITAYDPFVASDVMMTEGVRPVALDDVLWHSDFVSLHAPLTEGTRHLLNRERVDAMKRGACLINVSRGGLVDEKALADALEDGRLAGAALDVFESEPPSRHSPLLKSSSVVLSSHAAYYSVEAVAEVRFKAVEDVVRVLSGEEPVRAANPRAVTGPGKSQHRG